MGLLCKENSNGGTFTLDTVTIWGILNACATSIAEITQAGKCNPLTRFRKEKFSWRFAVDKNRMLCSCRVCGAHTISYLCETYNEHSNSTILSHYRCTECGSVFVANDVDSDELGAAYHGIDSNKYFSEVKSENLKKWLPLLSI
jgi:hypothetical protein